jgi:hypothetical protein
MIAYEKNNDDENGKPYCDEKFSLRDMLTRQKWDIVTIQQVSTLSHDITTYEPYITEIYNYIKKHAPQAKIYLHQTWAYRIDDPRFVTEKDVGVPHTHKLMYEQVHKANHIIAKKFKLDILPSGDAMYSADIDSKWSYKPDLSFDIKSVEFPDRPDQLHSLHQGYIWITQDDVERLCMDGHHANSAGEYLCAGVWFEILFGESFIDNSYVPEGIDDEYAAFLRRTAHKTVMKIVDK